MTSYWSFRPGHACPAINYFKVTFFATLIIWIRLVLILYLVSFCWPKFQSIFNPCNRPSIATDDRKQYQCQNIVVNNKTGPLFLEFIYYQKQVLAFYHKFFFFCHRLLRWERHSWECWQRHESIWLRTTVSEWLSEWVSEWV